MAPSTVEVVSLLGKFLMSREVGSSDMSHTLLVVSKIMVPPNHPILNRVWNHYKPSILGYHYFLLVVSKIPSLELTASLPLKMDGWETSFLLKKPIFRCELLVSGRVFHVYLGCPAGFVIVSLVVVSWWLFHQCSGRIQPTKI